MNFEWPHSNLDWLKARTVFLTRAGSWAYGTNTPTSDLDIRGIAVPPREYYLGFSKRFEQSEFLKPVDMVIFEIQKYFRLAAACNPNAIEIIHAHPRDHLKVTLYSQMVLEKKDLFLSRLAAKTFVGYAHSQINRLQNKLGPDGTYDGKHALHAVRLLREGKELIETGKVNVFRYDAEELLSIRRGEWTVDKLLEYANDTIVDLDRAAKTSPLPDKPDLEKLDELCKHVVELCIGL